MNIVKRNQPKQAGKVSEDDMLQEITIENGKVTNGLPLLDGSYIIAVIPNHEKTIRQWQEYYYQVIDSYCLDTGNERYWTHREFKKAHGIESITDLKTNVEWQICINQLKCWALMNS